MLQRYFPCDLRKRSLSLLSELLTSVIKQKSLPQAWISTPLATLSWGHLAEVLSKVVANWNRSNRTEISSRFHLHKVEVLIDFYHCDLFYLFLITLCHFLRSCKLTFTVFQNFSHVEGILSSCFTMVMHACLYFYNSMVISIMISWSNRIIYLSSTHNLIRK